MQREACCDQFCWGLRATFTPKSGAETSEHNVTPGEARACKEPHTEHLGLLLSWFCTNKQSKSK